MLESLFGLYGLAWWLIFRKFKLLPTNLWTVVTSILILVVVVALGILMLGRYQPMTSHARTYAVATPIVAEVRGKVIEVSAEGGAPVSAGDVLLRIDPESYQAQVDSIDAQLALAKTNLTQQERLAGEGATGVIELEKARSDVARLEADLRQARYALDRTTIAAPANGYVEQVAVRPGQFVSVEIDMAPGESVIIRVVEIVNLNPGNFFVEEIAPCGLADTNGDGLVTPADFNAWILAFNTQAPACDQNGDGLCTPADFNAWILNYNAGCP
jgi:multidrug resistance efflux pump